MDLLLELVEVVGAFGGLVQVTFDLLDPALKVHVAHVLFNDFLDHVAVLTTVDLRHLAKFIAASSPVAPIPHLHLEIHQLLLQLAQLLLMQLDLIPDLTDQMRVQPLQHIRHVLHFLETALFSI